MTSAQLDPAKEYRASMQVAALCFIKRHQAEHLAGDDQLFHRTTQYLVQGLQVPMFMAPRLVQLAMTELSPTVIGIDLANTPDTTVLTVLHQGHAHGPVLVASRILPQRLQAHAATP